MSYHFPKQEFQPKTIYDLFRHLINAAAFTSETEKQEYLTLVDKCESVNMFGTTAQLIRSENEQR